MQTQLPFVVLSAMILWTGLSSSAQAPPPTTVPPVALLRRLDGTTITVAEAQAFAEKAFKDNQVMGAQIAVLNQGRTVWTYAYGLRDAEKKLPMTPDTNIWAASITKGIFAVWVMHAVERHQIDLDQPVAPLLTHPLPDYAPYKNSAAELVRDPRWQQITPRILLSHTSGLSNFIAFNEPDKHLRLHFAPGTRFAYSGEGINLLQFVLEEKRHESLDKEMQRDLFTPLGLSRTGMVWQSDFADNTALRYDAHGKYLATTHRDRARAAGSLTTSVRDLSRFVEALLAHQILQPTTLRQMLTPQIAIRTVHQFPTLATAVSTEGEKVGLGYGMGWGLLSHTPYGPAFFKEGHGDGAETYVICFEESGTCLILLTNSDNGELAFRPLLERLIGDKVTPWEWEGYTRDAILHNEEHTPPNPPSKLSP